MTTNEINAAIAKITAASPNYCNDLNAMHEAESGLPDLITYTRMLRNVVCGAHWIDSKSHHATARQRAEAFLRTVGKWKD